MSESSDWHSHLDDGNNTSEFHSQRPDSSGFHSHNNEVGFEAVQLQPIRGSNTLQPPQFTSSSPGGRGRSPQPSRNSGLRSPRDNHTVTIMAQIRGDSVVGVLESGVRGQITGLINAPQLNGLQGTIVDFDSGTGRYKLHCEDESHVALRPENFMIASADRSRVRRGGGDVELGTTAYGAGNYDSRTSARSPRGGGGNDGGRGSKAPCCKDSLLMEEVPMTTYMFLCGFVWLVIVVMILIYAPRGGA